MVVILFLTASLFAFDDLIDSKSLDEIKDRIYSGSIPSQAQISKLIELTSDTNDIEFYNKKTHIFYKLLKMNAPYTYGETSGNSMFQQAGEDSGIRNNDLMFATIEHPQFNVNHKNNNGDTEFSTLQKGYSYFTNKMVKKGLVELDLQVSDGSSHALLILNKGLYDMINYLADKNFDINLQNNEGINSAMKIVSKFNSETTSKFLANHIFDYSLKNNSGENIGFIALKRGVNHLRVFLEREDFDPNLKGPEGKTLLIESIIIEDNDSTNMLLAHEKVDSSLKDEKGWSALDHLLEKQKDQSLTEERFIKNLQTLISKSNLSPSPEVTMWLRTHPDFPKIIRFLGPKFKEEARIIYIKELGKSEEKYGVSDCIKSEQIVFEDLKDINCALCLEKINGKSVKNTLCDCHFCEEGCKEGLATYMKNCPSVPKCPSCNNHLSVNLANELGIDAIIFKEKRLRSLLSEVPNMKVCETPDCSLSGKVLINETNIWHKCHFCHKETLLNQSDMQIIPPPDSSIRPCPHCYKLFAKDNACNHVTCENPQCKKRWNFVSGRNDPNGEFDLYDRGPRTYRVPGEKEGDVVYDDYTELEN